MEILLFILVIATVVLITWSAMIYQQNVPLRMPTQIVTTKIKKPGFDFDKVLPTRSLLDKTGMFVSIKNSLNNAHVNLSPVAFFNIKILLCILLTVVPALVMGKTEPPLVFIGLGIGYFGPDFYLKRKISERKYLIARGLPETVDLLSLCIEAGLDFVSAARWVIDKTPRTPMTEELAFVLEEVKWGKSRVQALKDMARRINVSEMSSFVQTIIQAERMGTPVAEAFAILSEDARAQRFHRGERIALQAPIKILLPLIFFIMPVIGIVIGGPILLQFMSGGFTGLK